MNYKHFNHRKIGDAKFQGEGGVKKHHKKADFQ